MVNKYLLLGQEKGLIQKKIDELYSVFKKEKSDVEFKTFYSSVTGDVALCASEMQETSLFATAKFVVLFDAEFLKSSDLKLLNSFLKNYNDDNTCFVLHSSWNKLPSFASSLEAQFDKSHKFIFYELSEAQKEKFIYEEFANNGYKIDSSVATQLLESTPGNVLELEVKIRELCNFAKIEKRKIDAEFLDLYLTHNRSENHLTFLKNIFEKKSREALTSLEIILSEDLISMPEFFASLIKTLEKVCSYCENVISVKHSDDPMTVLIDGKMQRIVSPIEKSLCYSAQKNYGYIGVLNIFKIVLNYANILKAEYDREIKRALLNKLTVEMIYFTKI